MGKRVLLAVNARARRGAETAARVAGILRRFGHTVVEANLLARPEDLSSTIVARRDEVDVVAVGGGDGTLLSAIAGLAETKLPLAIIPLGTFNELARTLGVPEDLEQVAALIDDGARLAIDVGTVNGIYFFNEASIGISTRVARLQTPELKRRLGMLSIPIATIRALRWLRPLHLSVADEQGSRRLRAVQLTVANNYRFGGVVENDRASLTDGALWMYSIDVRNWREGAEVVLAVARRRFVEEPLVTAVRGTRFTVRSMHRRSHRVFADGEDVTRLPATFGIEPGAVIVLVPPERLSGIH
jgi:YegS/Rv2252/BmrU family lipid kinase